MKFCNDVLLGGDILSHSPTFHMCMGTYIHSYGQIVTFLGAMAEGSTEQHHPEWLMCVCQFVENCSIKYGM